MAIKGAVVLLLFSTLYTKVWIREGVGAVWATFVAGMSTESWHLAAIVLLLMPLNWLVEAAKWRVLMRPFRQLTLWQALQGTLAGITLSLLTPNRLGEYGGRVLGVEAKDNWAAFLSTAVGNLCQLIVLFATGTAGLSYFCSLHFPSLAPQVRIITFLISILLWIMVLVLFRVGTVGEWIAGRLPGSGRMRRVLDQAALLRRYDKVTLAAGLGMAFLRYLIYSSQYFLLLLFFGVAVRPEAAYAGIATIFFIQTGLPLPPLMGLLARGEIALLVWGAFGANEFSILAATFALFIINLATPALLGLTFIVKTNVLKSLGYEKNPD